MANLTEREALTLDGILKAIARNLGYTENAILAEVGTELRAASLAIAALDAGTSSFAKVSYEAATELTIAAGAITVSKTAHRVDTTAEGISSDLNTINGGVAEDVLFLRPESGARTVVLKHNTGNIICPGGVDISLADAQDYAVLVFANAKWTVVAFNTLAEFYARLDGTQSFTGQKTFNHQNLRVANNSATFSSVFESRASAARAVALPNRSGTFDLAGTSQTLTGAGALDLNTPTTYFVSTGAAQAISIGDGLHDGQRKRIVHVIDGGSGVITPDLGGNLTDCTLTSIRDWVELEWDSAGEAWYVIGYSGATFT